MPLFLSLTILEICNHDQLNISFKYQLTLLFLNTDHPSSRNDKTEVHQSSEEFCAEQRYNSKRHNMIICMVLQ